jgi:hypothetical protein
VLVETTFQMHKVAALTQTHFLGEAGQLVQVRRKVGYSPNSGLRKIVKFHACAQSVFRATAFSATVRTQAPVSKAEDTVVRK